MQPECPVTRTGAIYRLGSHFLLCGDATNTKNVWRLMRSAGKGDEKAALLLTDPPYGVDYHGAAGTMLNDNLAGEQFRAFLSRAFSAACFGLRSGAAYYVWYSSSQAFNFLAAMRSVCWEPRETLIWVKPAFVMGRQDYHWRHEPCLYGWLDGAAHTWVGDRRQSTVLDFVKPVSSPDHPTMKPVALFSYLIGNSTNPGDIVLDLFSGSGTTALACERIGRRARLIEIDPRYCDVIRRRWAETVHGEGCDWESLTPEVPPHDNT